MVGWNMSVKKSPSFRLSLTRSFSKIRAKEADDSHNKEVVVANPLSKLFAAELKPVASSEKQVVQMSPVVEQMQNMEKRMQTYFADKSRARAHKKKKSFSLQSTSAKSKRQLMEKNVLRERQGSPSVPLKVTKECRTQPIARLTCVSSIRGASGKHGRGGERNPFAGSQAGIKVERTR